MKTLATLLALLAAGLAAAAPTKLVIWGMDTSAEAVDARARVAEFERRNPGIEVSVLSMGAGGMNPQKLMTAVVGGVPPDLVQQDRFTIGDWASRGAFRPLGDLLARDAARGGPLAVRERDYVAATWAEAVYRGEVYAIPNTTDVRYLFYNKALFREAGLDPQRPPQTWDAMLDAAKRLTLREPSGALKRVGLIPAYSQGWLYLWAWQNGGDAMSADGRTCTLAGPRTVGALAAMVSWYDALGGIDAINTFAGGFGAEEQDPFLSGKLAMRVDSDGFLNVIARYKPDLDFGVVPAPVPAERLRGEGRFAGVRPWVTWSGGHSFAIPQGSRHVAEAWEFVRWCNSPEASLIGARAQAEYARGKGRLFVPNLLANGRANALVLRAFRDTLPPRYLAAKEAALALLPDTRFRPVTFVGQRLWDEQVRAVDRATRHLQTPEQALRQAQATVQGELDSASTREDHPPLPMAALAMGSGILALASLGAGYLGVRRWMAARRAEARAEGRAGMLFVLPWVLGFLLLTAGPVLSSLVLSFCDYDVLHPARWAGLANYRNLLGDDRPIVLKSLSNVLVLAAVGIPLGMATSLAIALLLNTKVAGQRWYRTAFYMPSIVPAVATTVLWGYILNPDPARGLLNSLWQSTLTPWLGLAPPGWAAVPDWAKPGLVLIGLWGAGGGMILWLAGLESIPATLYEAASLDGARWWAQFRRITLPMLSPYIFFNLVMGTIGALQTFEQAYILGGTAGGTGTGPDDSLLVPVVHLFNNAFQYFKMGYASAIAWLLFVLVLGLTLGQLKLAPRWVHYEADRK